MRQAVTLSQRLPLCRAIWPLDMPLHLQIKNALSHHPNGMTVLEAYLLLSRQTGNERILRVAAYRLFNNFFYFYNM
jgi:hypothetical protein